MADHIAQDGYKDVGYEYVNVCDDDDDDDDNDDDDDDDAGDGDDDDVGSHCTGWVQGCGI